MTLFLFALKMGQIQACNFFRPNYLCVDKDSGGPDTLLSWEWFSLREYLASCASVVATLVFLQEGLGRSYFSHYEHKALASVISIIENRTLW